MTEKIKDIENLENARKRIKDKGAKLSNLLIHVGIDYINKIAGTIEVKDFTGLRDSISFRISSAIFHQELMLLHRNESILVVNREYRKGEKSRHNIDVLNHLQKVVYEQFIVLEDVIYSLTSVFDYFGNMVEYTLGGDKRKKRKWNSLVKLIRGQPDFQKHDISNKIISFHIDFVDRLHEYRSHLIHFKEEIGDFTITEDLNDGNWKLEIFGGTKMVKSFPELRKYGKEHKLTIDYITFWIINKTLDCITELILALQRDIEKNRIISSNEEIISWPKQIDEEE
mgnify:CR=1 FL=1